MPDIPQWATVAALRVMTVIAASTHSLELRLDVLHDAAGRQLATQGDLESMIVHAHDAAEHREAPPALLEATEALLHHFCGSGERTHTDHEVMRMAQAAIAEAEQ